MSSRSLYAWSLLACLVGVVMIVALLFTNAPLWLVGLAVVWQLASNVTAGVVWRTASEVDRNNAVPRERVVQNGRKPL